MSTLSLSDSNVVGTSDDARPYTSLIALNGSFHIPMNDQSSAPKSSELESTIVNIDTESNKPMQSSNQLDHDVEDHQFSNHKPLSREQLHPVITTTGKKASALTVTTTGSRPYNSLIALNGSFEMLMKDASDVSKDSDSESITVNIDETSNESNNLLYETVNEAEDQEQEMQT